MVQRKNLTSCRDLEFNWLGTDDQGRDVVARLIYGFRISDSMFGLCLTIDSSLMGITAGGVQGYFGGWVDLGFQRFIEVWTAIPSLYLLLILSFDLWCRDSLFCSKSCCCSRGSWLGAVLYAPLSDLALT